MKLITDAPADWPAVELAGLGVNHHMNAVNVAKVLTGAFNKNDKYQVSSFLESILLDHGILQTHITVTSSERKYYIFFFNENEEISSRFYSGIKHLLAGSDKIESVYYANFEINIDARPALPLRRFGPDLLTKLGKSTPEGSYVVWRNESTREKFSQTEQFQYIKEFQTISDGIQSYLLAEILRSVKEIEDNVGRIKLPDPDKEYSLGLVGPEDKPFILSASKKQGIMLHFHQEMVSSRYRTLFWKHFNSYVNELKEYIVQQNVEFDIYPDKSPKELWSVTSNNIIEKENKGDNIDSFGVF